MSTDRATPDFMTGPASRDQLMAAAARNEVAWLERTTQALHGRSGLDTGVHWAIAGDNAPRGTMLLAPGEAPRDVLAAVERVLQASRDAGASRVTCVSLFDDGLEAIGPMLGARGFRWGGRPHWMALDLHGGQPPPKADEFGSEFVATDDPGTWSIPELPLFNPDTGPVRVAMAQARPQVVWHLLVCEDGRPVGQSTANFTDGALGVCGLYETEILPASRTRGLGLDRVDFIRRFALDAGARYLITNAADTTDTLYRILGFRTVGRGQGWGMSAANLAKPADPLKLSLAEAIGANDISELDRIAREHGPEVLTELLANGQTPLQFSAEAAAGEAATWLISRGAAQDVLSLWRLQLIDDLTTLLREHPELLDARRPRSGRTLLHFAVQENDAGLVELLLAHGADVTVRDTRFAATAEQWAFELRHFQILRLLEARSASREDDR